MMELERSVESISEKKPCIEDILPDDSGDDTNLELPDDSGEDTKPEFPDDSEKDMALTDDAKVCGSNITENSDTLERITTRNQALEGKNHPETGVPFENRVISLPNGEEKEGVFPKFPNLFEATIPEDLLEKSDKEQFKVCNKQLYEAIQKDPELRAKFTDEQIEQICDGISDGGAPDGYVWHHDADTGKIQLVDSEIHAKTGHTGGRSVWGGGSDNR